MEQQVRTERRINAEGMERFCEVCEEPIDGVMVWVGYSVGKEMIGQCWLCEEHAATA